jgi:hypothetical protein
MARFTTAHQIGTVFESASGKRFPERVESTRIMLVTKAQSLCEINMMSIPMMLQSDRQQVEVGSTEIEAPVVVMAIRGFEVRKTSGLTAMKSTDRQGLVQEALAFVGLTYQAPARRLAAQSFITRMLESTRCRLLTDEMQVWERSVDVGHKRDVFVNGL